MRSLNVVDWVTLILVIIGGLNWGLVGLFGFNLVSFLFGDMSALSRLIYIVVGVCAIYIAIMSVKYGRRD